MLQWSGLTAFAGRRRFGQGSRLRRQIFAIKPFHLSENEFPEAGCSETVDRNDRRTRIMSHGHAALAILRSPVLTILVPNALACPLPFFAVGRFPICTA